MTESDEIGISMPNSKPDTVIKKFRGSGRVAFFKYKDEVKKAVVDEGYPVKAVYENLGEKMPISYQMFHRYVQRHVLLNIPRETEKPPSLLKKNQPERPKPFTYDSSSDLSVLDKLV